MPEQCVRITFALQSLVSQQQWTTGLSMPRFPVEDRTGLLCSSVYVAGAARLLRTSLPLLFGIHPCLDG